VSRKGCPQRVSRLDFPAMQAGLNFRGGTFQKGRVRREILYPRSVIIEKIFERRMNL